MNELKEKKCIICERVFKYNTKSRSKRGGNKNYLVVRTVNCSKRCSRVYQRVFHRVKKLKEIREIGK